jgi:beta-galactosidase
MVSHVGREGRIWSETVALGGELSRLAEVAGSTAPLAEVACLIDWESWWALDGKDHPSGLLSLPDILQAWYAPLFSRGIQVDMARPSGDHSGRRLLLAPNLHLATDEALRSLTAYAEAGGVLVVGAFSCVVDHNDHIRLDGAADDVLRLLGVRVDEFWPLAPGDATTVRFASGATASAHLWTEWLRGGGPAESVATYADGPLEGLPAVTRHAVGAGAVYYCSAGLDRTGLSLLLELACAEAGVGPLLKVPAGVEVCRRTGPDRSYLFVLNHTDVDLSIDLPAGGPLDLLTGREVVGALSLSPLGVAVLRDPVDA